MSRGNFWEAKTWRAVFSRRETFLKNKREKKYEQKHLMLPEGHVTAAWPTPNLVSPSRFRITIGILPNLYSLPTCSNLTTGALAAGGGRSQGASSRSSTGPAPPMWSPTSSLGTDTKTPLISRIAASCLALAFRPKPCPTLTVGSVRRTSCRFGKPWKSLSLTLPRAKIRMAPSPLSIHSAMTVIKGTLLERGLPRRPPF